MLRLKGGNVGDGGEDITGVGGGSFDAVPVVNTTLASLGVDIKPLQVVVEIHGAGAEVSAEKSSVGREDGSNVNASLLGEGQGDTSQPLVEMGNDGLFLLMDDKLERGSVEEGRKKNHG